MRKRNRSNCFVAGTAVETAYGEVPIEQLRVGERVLTTADTSAAGSPPSPEGDPNATQVDPATWREVTLDMPDPQTPGDDYQMQLLEPLSWVQQNQAATGSWVDLDLPELQINGEAQVESVAACPPIEAGAGRVLLGTFTHISSDLVKVTLAGDDAPLEVTAGHKLWSLDRGDWVEAGDLRAGERLAGEHGPVVVQSVVAEAGQQRVYNLDVETDHRYLVGDLGVLAHNVGPCGPAGQSIVDQAKASGLDSLKTAGTPGTSPNIREFTGTEADARAIFDGLTQGGALKKDSPTFALAQMNDGTFVTFRAAGKVPNQTTGVAPPTIDINVPGSAGNIKLKLLP